MKTISVGLVSFFGTYQSDISGMMEAVIISSTVPLILYIFFQKQIQRGLTAGAVKG